MNEWVINDMIKMGKVTYNIGDEVVILKRKPNGHPRGIKDNVTYTIKHIDSDGHLMVASRSSNGIGFLQPIRVHKTYVINKSILRDIKLSSILDI